ncbi:hypothetical protein D9M71_801510 [compost metagenome]
MRMFPEEYPVIVRSPLWTESAVAEVEIDEGLGMKNDHRLEPLLGGRLHDFVQGLGVKLGGKFQ